MSNVKPAYLKTNASILEMGNVGRKNRKKDAQARNKLNVPA